MTWTNAIIGDLVEPKVDQGGPSDTEFTYVDISSIDNATKRVADPKRLPREKAPSRARQRLRARDVVVSMTRPNLNAVALLPSELDGAIGSTGFDVLRAKPGVEPAWLYYAVQTPTFIHTMSGVVQGALYPAVRPKDIRDFPLIVPPLDEQRRIVAEIEEQLSRLEAGVAALKRVQANLKRYRASVLTAACSGRLVPTEAALARTEGRGYETSHQLLARILEQRPSRWTGKSKYKEPTAPDSTNLPVLPERWTWASVDQLVAHVTDGDHQPPPQTEQGVPFLVIGNVRTGQIDFTETRFVGRSYYDSLDPMRQPRKGDLLYTLVGSFGIPVLVSTDEPFCIQRHMAILRPHEFSPINYLAIAMATDLVLRQAISVATGTAQKTVPLAGLRRIAIPLPPQSEQHRIVAEVDRRLSIVREAEQQVEADLTRGERLRLSALQFAFQTGASNARV